MKQADIVVMDKDRPNTVYMLVELKKPKLKDGKNQLRSYCNATGAPIAVWTNGDQISYYQRKDPNYFEDIPDLPMPTKPWQIFSRLSSLASMYPAISTEDLLNIPITLPQESTRQKVTEKVGESRKAREQSKHLLEIAKTGVERAIETDEATAMTWINQQLEGLEVILG